MEIKPTMIGGKQIYILSGGEGGYMAQWCPSLIKAWQASDIFGLDTFLRREQVSAIIDQTIFFY